MVECVKNEEEGDRLISSIADIEDEWNGRLEQEDGGVLYQGRGRKKKKL